MRHALALMLALLAAPAAAQDLAAQYEDAVETFGSAVPDGREAGARVGDAIAGWEGDWIDAGVLANGAPLPLDIIPTACERNPERLERAGDWSFTLTRASAEASFAVRYDYAGFRSFQRSADPEAVAAYLRLPAEMMAEQLGRPTAWQGMAQVAQPSPDILVITAERQPPMILARCP
jgi:hypothetical protein